MYSILIRTSTRIIMSLFLLIFFTIVIAKDANAYCCGIPKVHVPVAICSTGGTNIPLPYFVCCQLIGKRGQSIWRNTWVPTACQNANSMATYDLGCTRKSPVYSTASPLLGNCQYSHSRSQCCPSCCRK